MKEIIRKSKLEGHIICLENHFTKEEATRWFESLEQNFAQTQANMKHLQNVLAQLKEATKGK